MLFAEWECPVLVFCEKHNNSRYYNLYNDYIIMEEKIMNVNARTTLRRLLAMLLCVAMLAGFAVSAFAADTTDPADTTVTTDPAVADYEDVNLRKTAKLDKDGTYTIDLEAFAKGETYKKPVDMVLVLDQSASMYTPMGLSGPKYNPALFAPTSNLTYYTEDTLKTAFEDPTFQENVKQLGYLIAQSRVGSYRYCKDATHWEADGTHISTTKKDGTGTCDKKHGTLTCVEAKSDDNTANDCCTTFDWFVVQYVEDGTNKPWKFYRVPSSTCPSPDSQVTVVKPILDANGNPVKDKDDNPTFDLDESHEPDVVTYQTIDKMKLSDGSGHFYFYETQYAALYDSITAFAAGLEASGADHRLTVAGFSQTLYYRNYANGSGIYNGGTFMPYSGDYRGTNPNKNNVSAYKDGDNYLPADTIYARDLNSANNYANAWMRVQTESSKITAALKAVKSDFYGTAHAAGFDMALKALNNAPAVATDKDEIGRDKVVVMFTDGQPSETQNIKTESEIVRKAVQLKDAKYTVYTICTSTLVGDANASVDFMRYASSDYPEAESLTNPGAPISEPKYFKYVTSAEDMVKEFLSIVDDFNLKLGSTTVLKDIMGSNFILPEGFDVTNIKISTVAVTETITDGKATYTADDASEDVYTVPEGATGTDDGNGNISYTFKNSDGKELTVTYNKGNSEKPGEISVTGFDYAANYVAAGRTEPGRKLVIQITGVEATKDVPVSQPVATNNPNSGVYHKTEDGSIVSYEFPVPTVMFMSKVYVLDYAKEFEIYPCEWFDNIYGIGEKPSIFKDENGDIVLNTLVETTYGDFKATPVEAHAYCNCQAHLHVKFMPKTMQWDKEAQMFVFGKAGEEVQTLLRTGSETANIVDYSWTKVSVIPANNIYYEDDFATKDKDGKDTGLVGIEYTGSWTIDGTTNNGTTENPENAEGVEEADKSFGGVHGWEDALAGDTGYSDGSAHKVDVSGNIASAKFKFTGTGVDIYSRTNSSTGTVLATLSENDNTVASQFMIVDTVSNSGDYYQIPTLSFENLEYGTYTVNITVTKGAAKEGRFIYYLDGIRVYNPIEDSDKVSDEVVTEGYKENEMNAVFTEVRDILIGANDFGADGKVSGAVFIDELKAEQVPEGDSTVAGTPTTTTNVIGVYEDFGPKNEVYLKSGQAIAFQVVPNEGQSFYVGLKAPENGKTATALVSSKNDNGEVVNKVISVDHSTDLYYEVKPDNGYIIIQNDDREGSGGLLSVTKIRTTGATDAISELKLPTIDEASVLEAMVVFSTRPVVKEEVTGDVEIFEEEIVLDKPNVIGGSNEVEMFEGEIEINNPTVLGSSADLPQAETETNVQLVQLMNALFKNLFKWFC